MDGRLIYTEELVFYDAINDGLVVAQLLVSSLTVDYYNNLDHNLNDIKRIRFKGDTTISNEGSVYLGPLN